jgi:hypothetical protein
MFSRRVKALSRLIALSFVASQRVPVIIQTQTAPSSELQMSVGLEHSEICSPGHLMSGADDESPPTHAHEAAITSSV